MTSLLLDQLPEQWRLPEEDKKTKYRRKQICDWIFRKRVTSFEEMKNLPQQWREQLTQDYEIRAVEKIKVQGTTTKKFLWQLRDHQYVESVLIPASPSLYGAASDRRTLCISTQVGCAHGCGFCASGLDGFQRNLTPAEIIGQILETERVEGKNIHNIVFMGMGEPFANWDNLMTALDIINAPWGCNIGARHITVSTCGLVPQIEKFAQDARQFQLAVSLHGASDNVRNQIMPINKKYPLEQLLRACREYTKAKNRKITFEYILIDGLNDSTEQAVLLARHAKAVRAKVNLIPYNPVDAFAWKRPEDARVSTFLKELKSANVPVTLRREKGLEIDSACGQLRRVFTR